MGMDQSEPTERGQQGNGTATGLAGPRMGGGLYAYDWRTLVRSIRIGLSACGLGLLLATSAAAQAPRCDYGTAHPGAPAELSQFAFLIGDFDITSHAWRGGAWTPPRPGPHARWNGWYGLGGMAIYDEWYDPNPGEDPNAPRGVNVRMYDSDAGQWKMMWMDTGGLRPQDLRAEMRDGKLTMWQEYPDRPNFLAKFTTVDADHWYRVSYTRDEQGEWVKQFKLAASRIPCS